MSKSVRELRMIASLQARGFQAGIKSTVKNLRELRKSAESNAKGLNQTNAATRTVTRTLKGTDGQMRIVTARMQNMSKTGRIASAQTVTLANRTNEFGKTIKGVNGQVRSFGTMTASQYQNIARQGSIVARSARTMSSDTNRSFQQMGRSTDGYTRKFVQAMRDNARSTQQVNNSVRTMGTQGVTNTNALSRSISNMRNPLAQVVRANDNMARNFSKNASGNIQYTNAVTAAIRNMRNPLNDVTLSTSAMSRQFQSFGLQGQKAAQNVSRQLEQTSSKAPAQLGNVQRAASGVTNTINNMGSGISGFRSAVRSIVSPVMSATGAIKKNITSGIIMPFREATGVVKGYAAALGLLSAGALGNTGMGRLSAIENSRVSLEVMMGDAEKAQKFLDEVLDFARTTPFAFPDLAASARNLVAFGMNAKDVVPTLKAIGDAAAGAGKGSEGLNMIASAFGDIQVAGKLGMDQINRLASNGVPALQILANQAGISAEEMRKKISDGSIGAEEAIKGLVKGMQEGTKGVAGNTAAMGGLMERMKDTWTGSVDSMKSSISSTMATLLEDAKPHIQDFMAFFASSFSKLPDLFNWIGESSRKGLGIAAEWLDKVTGNTGLFTKTLGNTVKETSIFGDSISDETQKAVGGFMDLYNDSVNYMNQMKWGNQTVTDEMAKEISGRFHRMKDEVIGAYDEQETRTLESMQSLFENSKRYSEKEQKELLEKTKEGFEQRRQSTEDAAKEIEAIYKQAADANIEITDYQQKRINELQETMKTNAVSALSTTSQESIAILEAMNEQSSELSAQQAAEVVKNSKAQHDEVVANAQSQYEEQVAAIIMQRDELGTISRGQAAEMISEARKQKEGVEMEAKGLHDAVVTSAKEAAGEHVGVVDWETGEIRNRWEQLAYVMQGLAAGDMSVLEALGMNPEQIEKIQKFVDTIKGKFNELTTAIVGFAMMMWQGMQDFWSWLEPYVMPILERIGDFFGETFNKIKEFIQGDGKQILDAAQNLFMGIMAVVDFVMPFVKFLVETVWGSVENVINGALNFIMGLLRVFSGLFTGDWSKMWEGIKGLVMGAVELVWGIINLTFFGRIVKGALGFIKSFWSIITDLWKVVVELFKGGVGGAWTALKTAWNNIWTFTKNTFNAIWNFLKSVWDGIKTVFNVVVTIFNIVKNGFNRVWNTTKSIFLAVWNFLKNTWNNIWGAIREFVSRIVTNISSGFNTAKNTISRIFSAVWSFIKKIWSSIWGSIRDFVARIVNAIKTRFTESWNTIKSIWNRVWGFVKDIWGKIWGSIKDRVDRIFNGIRDGFNKAKDKVSTILGDMWQAVKDKFNDIVDIAKGLPKRIGDGIGKMASKVMEGLKKVSNKMLEGLAFGVNGVIGGVNWVLDKIGVDESSQLKEWEPNYYKDGTKGHPGGPAVVGDGGMSELIAYPDGSFALSPDTDTLVNLPRGTSVLSGPETKEFMSQVPMYNNGVGPFGKVWNGMKSLGGKAIDAAKSGIGALKDKASEIWDWAAGGAKSLVDKVLKTMGVEAPDMNGGFGAIAKGAYGFAKDKIVDFVGSMLPGFGDEGGIALNFPPPFRMTSKFNPNRKHPITGKVRPHNGIDFAAPIGTRIPAQAGGTVSYSGTMRGYGNIVIVKGPGGMEYRYAHNSKNLVSVGDSVKAGQAVALVGSTGQSTGPHVHFEVRRNGTPIDPLGAASGGGAFKGSGASGMVKTWIMQAINATGVPKSWLEPLATIAQKESGGNPRAINLWDSNYRRGTPSKGLMQTIDPTFNAYKKKGMDNIWNPVHNAVAAIRYIVKRYGSVFETPGIKSMMRGGGYKGYADGAIVDTAQLAWIAEGGWAESIISHDPSKKARSRAIWKETGDNLGFTDSDNRVVQLLQELNSLVGNGFDSIPKDFAVQMDGRQVGYIVEPHVSRRQAERSTHSSIMKRGGRR
ncbi:peptidoglycan DD-metalloendopeptidase family protein [Shouchella clausii]|uniref:peptidoglycan DD-metalloendopeptidase family protein n=1 Tax=Shouchella clausii TaxID=79880 RepID=UPI000680F5A7|nr:peptidoglycan DD-metalloendopeptidase family protein [Shouchella clausii]